MAKYQLLLGEAGRHHLCTDYDIAMQNLESVQEKITPGKTGQNLIVLKREKKVLCFTQPVFEPRRPPQTS